MDLAPDADVRLIFTWNTAFAEECHNYTVRGEATIIPYEYNTTNNVCVDGYIKVRILGDVDGDSKVDGKDVFVVSSAFGSYGPDYVYPGSTAHPRWNHTVDLNNDNRLDGRDMFLVTTNSGNFCFP